MRYLFIRRNDGSAGCSGDCWKHGQTSGQTLRTARGGVVDLKLLACCFHGFSQCRNYFEQIADDAVIGYFEDRCFGIFVDGNDALSALHADEMLNGAGDPDGEVELGCDSLTGTADLAFDGQPAVIADGARGGEFRTERGSKILDERKIVGFLDTATDGNDQLRRAEVYSLGCATERLAGFGANLCCVDCGSERVDFGSAGLADGGLGGIGTEGA